MVERGGQGALGGMACTARKGNLCWSKLPEMLFFHSTLTACTTDETVESVFSA